MPELFLLTCPSGHRVRVAPSRVTWIERCMYCGSEDVARERIEDSVEGCSVVTEAVILHDKPWNFGTEPALRRLVRHLLP